MARQHATGNFTTRGRDRIRYLPIFLTVSALSHNMGVHHRAARPRSCGCGSGNRGWLGEVDGVETILDYTHLL